MSLNIHEQDLGNGEQIEESCISTQKNHRKKDHRCNERMRNTLGSP